MGGYSPLASGLATLPTTVIMFLLSRRFGALADRLGPRLFLGAGPLVAAAGLALFLRVGPSVGYLATVLPAQIVFAVGLSMTVAPLTATVLAGVHESQAGIASGVNNAIARVAGLLSTAAAGTVVSARFASSLGAGLRGHPLSPAAERAVVAAKHLALGRPSVSGLPAATGHLIAREATDASVAAFHLGLGIAALLVAGGGVIAVLGIVNPSRVVRARECEGGQLLGAPRDAAGANDSRTVAPRRPREASEPAGV